MKQIVTKERLIEYKKLLQEIDNQYIRLDRMEESIHNPSAQTINGMPGSSNISDRTGSAAIRKLTLEEDIKANEATATAEYEFLESAIKRLEDPDERQILRLVYFDAICWQEVCKSLYGQQSDFDDRYATYKRRMYEIHKSALVNIQKDKKCTNPH